MNNINLIMVNISTVGFMRQIAIYGKGGVGKSITTGNISVSLALAGNNVLQIGCDPKHDSTRYVLNDQKIKTVLDCAKELREDEIKNEHFVKIGYAGVRCIEAGGPEPGVGCAGRGIILATDIMKKKGLFEDNLDYIFYDVLGDVVCGGFAVPIREGFAKEVYIVVSGELLSLYAANNICKAIKRYGPRSGVGLGGIIGNLRQVPNEVQLIESFSESIGSRVIGIIPRDSIVQQAESKRKTILEYDPKSKLSSVFIELAKRIEENEEFVIPTPLEEDEFEELINAAYETR